ncbi:MAG: helix-turn-helix domain-containing protein [Luteitalea sp.]|nr:helix-turn-helix domain-containing protein [Luteitalea sp.]
MVRRVTMRAIEATIPDCGRGLRTLGAPGLRVFEAIYEADCDIPAQPYEWATLCLTIDGGYCVDWHRSRLRCGPAALVFQPPGEIYGARISSEGSHCLQFAVDPLVLQSIDDRLSDWERLRAPRRPPPHWLAFEVRRELELGDDLSATSVEAAIIALLAELGEVPGLEALSAPAPWLERVREQLHDEFRQRHTLENLACTVGVHRVHLAREFRRCFGCTVGHYIRQRRVEFACHRLAASPDSLSRIAFDAGFADQSHFTNTFRRLVGVSPGVFRGRFGTIRRSH